MVGPLGVVAKFDEKFKVWGWCHVLFFLLGWVGIKQTLLQPWTWALAKQWCEGRYTLYVHICPTYYLCIYTCVVICASISTNERVGFLPWTGGNKALLERGPVLRLVLRALGDLVTEKTFGKKPPQKVHYREVVCPAISGRSRLLKSSEVFIMVHLLV